MSYLFSSKGAQRGLLLCACLSLLILALSVQAQEAASTDDPQQTPLATETLVGDPLPGETATDVGPIEIPVLPTQEITPTEIAPIPTGEAPIATQDVMPLPTEDATSIPTSQVAPIETTPSETATPVEPALDLPLVFNANFDTGYPSELSLSTGWIDVNVVVGKALQANVGAVPVNYTAGTFTDAAAEAKFLLNTGEGQVLLRGYAAGLADDGTVTLYRNQVALISGAAPLTSGEWATLHIQIINSQIHISVNGTLILDYTDTEVLPAGTAGFAASTEAALRIDDFAIYGTPTANSPITTQTPIEDKTSTLPMSGELLNTPTNIVLAGNGTSVDVSWDDINVGEAGYEIQRYVSEAYLTTSIIGAAADDTTTFTEANVGCGLTLWYRVRAVGSTDSSTSAWSDWVSVTTAPCTAVCSSTDAVQRVSVGSNNTYQTNSVLMPSGRAIVSTAGYSFVLFGSANPLQNPTSELAGENNAPNVADAYLYVTQDCTTYQVSRTNSGTESAQAAYAGGLDYLTGPLVGLDSTDPNLTSNDGSSLSSAFISDGENTLLVSLQTGGSVQIPGNSRVIDIKYPYILMSTDGDLTGLFGVSDTNNANDLVLYNHQTQTLSLVTFDHGGGFIANNGSFGGRVFVADDNTPYVLFNSYASNLISGGADTNLNCAHKGIDTKCSDVFLRNMGSGSVTTRISLSDTEGQLNSTSTLGGFSLVGSTLKVAFESISRETGTAGGPNRILVRTLSLTTPTPATSTTILASRATGAAGTIASMPSYGGRLSNDGRWVLFSTTDASMVSGDTNGVSDVFVRDLSRNITQRISLSNAGAQLSQPSAVVDIREDGQHILFSSADSTIVSTDTANVCETDLVDSKPSVTGIQYDYNDNCVDVFMTSNPLAYSATPINVVASTTYSDKVRLTWSALSDVQGFIVEVSTDNGVTWNTASTINESTATTYDYALVCSASIQLRVKSTVTTPYPLTSAYSSVVTGKTALCTGPVLATPVDKALFNIDEIGMSWSKPHPDVYGYEVDLATAATFTAATRVAGYPRSASTESSLTDSLPDGTYYWRVRTSVPGFGSYSVTRSFTVDTAAPSAPVITAPENVSTIRSMTVKFTWTAVSSAVKYSLVVTDGTNAMVNQPQLTALTYTFTGTPVQSIYTATVIAYDAAGNASPSSQVAFTLNPALTPADNAIALVPDNSNFSEVTFTWAGTGANTQYAVQLFYDQNFLGIGQVQGCTSTGTLSCTISNLTPTTYYWRVIRSDEDPNIIVPISNKLYVSPALPSLQLETPANNAILTPSQHPSGVVTLTWDKGGTEAPYQFPLIYQVEVNTSSTFAVEPVSDVETLDQTSTTPSLADGTYYWRVRARNAYSAVSAWTATSKFVIDSVAPATPVLVTPVDQAVIQTPKPMITWTGPTDAYRYEVEINETCGDGTPVYNSGATITAKTFTLPTSLGQGTQQVCVRAYDVAMNPSAFSVARTINVFLGVTPAHQAFTAAAAKPTFTWLAAAGTGLELEYSTDSTFTTSTVVAVTGTSKTLAAPLSAGVYYWRIRRSGETFVGTPSRTLYIGSLLSGPTQIAPSNGTTLSTANTTVDLTWDDVVPVSMPGLDITDYELVISKSATFSPAILTTTVNEGVEVYTWTLPSSNRITYYWRVRARSNGLPVSNWSATRSIIVDNVAPFSPTFTNPTNNAVLNTVRPTFTWGAVAGATGYRVSLTDITTSQDLVSDLSVTTPSYTPAFNLPQDQLTLSVIAIDGLNESTPGEVTFNVRLGTTPANNAAITTPRPAFTWSAVPGTSVKYTLQVANNLAFSPVVFSQSNIAATTYTPTEAQKLITAGVYYWRVTHTGLNGATVTGARTLIYSVTGKPLNPVARVNGMAGSVDTIFNASEDAPIGLTWDAPAAPATPTAYKVEIATNATFTTGLIVQPSIMTTSSTITEGTLANGTYYWRVKALYSADETSAVASETKTFTLDTAAPLAPLALNFTNTAALRPTFTWASAATAKQYHMTLYAGTSAVTMTPVTGYEDVLVAATTYTIPLTNVPLQQLNRTKYYGWTVRSEDTAGNIGGESTLKTMTVAVDRSPGFEPIDDSTPTFTWTAIKGSGLGTVKIQIATDSDMNTIIHTSADLTEPVSSYTLPAVNALQPGVYYWRVIRSIDDQTYVNRSRMVIVDSLVGITPVVTGPAAGTTLSRAQLLTRPLTWTTIPTTTAFSYVSYGFYLYTMSSTGTMTQVLNHNWTTTSYGDQLAYLTSGGTYYWAVRARLWNNGEYYEGPLTAYRKIIIDIAPPSVPALTLPVDNAVITTTRRPTFSWKASTGGAVQYVFQLSTASNFSTVRYTTTLTATQALTVTLPSSQALPNGTYYWRVVAKDALGNDNTIPPSDLVARQLRIAVP